MDAADLLATAAACGEQFDLRSLLRLVSPPAVRGCSSMVEQQPSKLMTTVRSVHPLHLYFQWFRWCLRHPKIDPKNCRGNIRGNKTTPALPCGGAQQDLTSAAAHCRSGGRCDRTHRWRRRRCHRKKPCWPTRPTRGPAEKSIASDVSDLALAPCIMHDIVAADLYGPPHSLSEECSSMARAPVSKTGGCRFESCHSCQGFYL